MSATLPIAATPCAHLPRITQSEPRASAINHAPAPVTSFTPIVTLVLWSGCLLVGVLGLLPPHTPSQPAPEPPPLTAEKITVQLTNTPPATTATPPLATPQTTPSITPPLAPPVAVAAPSPALAFIIPVTGPVRIVPANQAASSSQSAPAAAAPPSPVQALVFGQGEGLQPAPAYPSESIRQGQEGTVSIRFTVGPRGHVTAAEVAAPSPWPLLDDSAAYTVRHSWHFPRGESRTYEVAIRFSLQK